LDINISAIENKNRNTENNQKNNQKDNKFFHNLDDIYATV